MKKIEKIFLALIVLWALAVLTFSYFELLDNIDKQEPEFKHYRAADIIIDNTPLATIQPQEETFEEIVTEVAIECRTEAPIEEKEEPKTIKVMATAYSNSAEDNWPFQAHDCKYGFDLIDGQHIAANLSILPYGTRVYIEGLGERTVVDTASAGSLQKTQRMAEERGCELWIDVYMGNRYEDVDTWGIKEVNLTIIEMGEGK